MQTKWESFQAFMAFASPSLGLKLGVCPTPKEVSDFFSQIIKDTVNHRTNNKTDRNDFLQILLNLMKSLDAKEEPLTILDLTAQAFVFFLAGFETSSTTMTFCLFELAKNPHIQEKVREEINTILNAHDGKLTYDALKEMKYMKQVIDEVMRLHPPVPILNRKCVINYTLPNTDVIIEKGTGVVIPLYGLHYDPEYFPQPEKFDPERFNEENKKCVKPFTYMPFGEGPRLCIGLRFGLMQTGVGLALLLRKFRFSLSDKTNLPLKMSPFSFTLSVLGDIWLNANKV